MRGATNRSAVGNHGALSDFNPRAPCGARPPWGYLRACRCRYFNPRAPCGARRSGRETMLLRILDFNPRAPCGARRVENVYNKNRQKISIHAPHAGRDSWSSSNHLTPIGFQSTRPMRGATSWLSTGNLLELVISIHAPHAGRDILPALPVGDGLQISIHAPHAGRDALWHYDQC